MTWKQKIEDVQRHLTAAKIDGWLLYDFSGLNPLAREFLKIPSSQLTTRRFFYWIPAMGEPVQIVHQIEQQVLASLPGSKKVYLKWQELETALAKTLNGCKTIAMEYSPRNAIPYLSKVDGGMIDLVRSFNVEIVSSGTFLQYYTCVLNDEQLQSHLDACEFLDKTAEKTWDMIADFLQKGKSITEYGVSQFIANEIAANGFMQEARPICAVNAHAADPHFEPRKEEGALIKRGDFILIDLWCKKQTPRAVYGDITRVAVADAFAKSKQEEIFKLVRNAQKAATDYISERWSAHEEIKGYEVDKVCRQVIEEAGYGEFFVHRTGHNIYTKDHGPGAHIDSLETQDFRPLIPRSCFSIEPGIYLPGEFGIRLEHDVYLSPDHTVLITGGIQETLLTLF
ncbi:MAG: M24 family metallopeptidase [Rhabdochlamydiaceae bacterium]|nr:M24 family metallopeptidase [Rhabdochlamydiaceae bacterium]